MAGGGVELRLLRRPFYTYLSRTVSTAFREVSNSL